MTAHAAQVTLAWDPSDGATGYNIYYGTTSKVYTSVVNVGNVTTFTFSNLANNTTYYFAATAYDLSGNESDYSDEIVYNSSSTAATPSSYTIIASAGTGGTISPSGNVSVTGGSNRTYTITPNSGYRISAVNVDGTSVGAVSSYTFYNVTAAHTISATFTRITYSLNVTRTGTGTVTTNPTGTTFNAGTVVTLTASAGTGYVFAGWSGACSGTGTTCQVTMNSDTSVSAAFSTKSYIITASAGLGGAISPTGSRSVNYGSSQTYMITPNNGYLIANVVVDGVAVGAVGSYTFSNVTAAHTISVIFNKQIQILWRNKSTGANQIWYMDGTTVISSSALATVNDTNWEISGTGDFNSDGKSDILWRNVSSGDNTVWYMDGVTRTSYVKLTPITDTNWQIVGTGDFNSDGKTDILWRNISTGANTIWYMDGTTRTSYDKLATVTDTNWQIVGISN